MTQTRLHMQAHSLLLRNRRKKVWSFKICFLSGVGFIHNGPGRTWEQRRTSIGASWRAPAVRLVLPRRSGLDYLDNAAAGTLCLILCSEEWVHVCSSIGGIWLDLSPDVRCMWVWACFKRFPQGCLCSGVSFMTLRRRSKAVWKSGVWSVEPQKRCKDRKTSRGSLVRFRLIPEPRWD